MSSYYDDPDFADEYRQRDKDALAAYVEERERDADGVRIPKDPGKRAVLFDRAGLTQNERQAVELWLADEDEA